MIISVKWGTRLLWLKKEMRGRELKMVYSRLLFPSLACERIEGLRMMMTTR